LQSRRDVDAFAVAVLALDDYLAKIDADAYIDVLILGDRSVALSQATLQRNCAFDRIDNAAEFGEKAVPHQLEDPAVVPVYLGLEKFLPVRLDSIESTRLVTLHERRVTYDVSRKNGREFAFHKRLLI
jgi:hypothetical protein